MLLISNYCHCLLFFVMILLLCGCTEEESSPLEAQSDKSNYTAVIEIVDPLPPKRMSLPFSAGAYNMIFSNLRYQDTIGLWQEFIPTNLSSHLNIATKSMTEVVVDYLPGVVLKYYLMPGDSARLSYPEGIPHLQYINSISRATIPNLDLMLLDSLSKGTYRERDKLQNAIAHFQYDFETGNPKEYQQGLRNFNERMSASAKAEAMQEKEILTDLLHSGRLSELEYIYRVKGLELIINPQADRQGDTITQSLMAYQDYLGRLERQGVERGIKWNYEYLLKDSLSYGIDWLHLLRRQLRMSIETDDRKEGMLRLSNYLAITDDDEFHDYLFSHFDYDKSVVNDLKLLSSSGDTVSWNEVIATQEGKVLYVDFWASWCQPCRAKMPALHLLQERIATDPIEVILISIDESQARWQLAARKEKFADYKHSYLALNPRSSSFIIDRKIDRIPRYLVYGPRGELVIDRAPDPEAVEIGKLRNKL